MKHMREACSRIDRNRQFTGSSLYLFIERDGIPVVVDGGCCSPVIVSLASRKVEDPALALDIDPAIERCTNDSIAISKKNSAGICACIIVRDICQCSRIF